MGSRASKIEMNQFVECEQKHELKWSCLETELIPDDTEFQLGDMPNYTTSDGSVKIQKDSEVRLKIIGIRVDFNSIYTFCIGTTKDNFLGVINDHTAV
ncbi:hypothetical protein Dsin_013011 [Dipteronia sinensis]|uniref:Uncharacterized protein n=1 Tax=Dipteronia sinensis TaxID=43782 RepID=A0AAE0AJ50_9ROSI|nr:hypothetical protein Dsin_013011 [Dipteronia sinensis]